MTRTIPVSPPIVLPRSSSVPLDKLADDELSDLGFMTPKMTVSHIREKVSLDLNTDQGDGINDKLKFSA